MMLRYFSIVILFPAIVSSAFSQGSLEGIKQKFSSINSFSTTFSQATIPVVGDTQYFEGSLVLARPANLRMKISSPEEQLIVFNGERAWLYLPEKNLCYTYSSTSLGNLAKIPEYIFDPFEKLDVDTFYQTEDQEFFIAFASAEDDPFIERINITISVESLLPRQLLIKDRAGTETSYDFSEMTINTKENISFTFTPPESTEVIEQ